MNSLQKYENTFAETFEMDNSLVSSLVYGKSEKWDSVAHMALIAALENTFDIMLDMDDIIDFSSFEKGKEILTKYDVEF